MGHGSSLRAVSGHKRSIRSSPRKRIGANIAAKRKELHLTGDELAEALCVSIGHVRLIETGKRGTSIDILCRISGILACSVDGLIGDAVMPPAPESFMTRLGIWLKHYDMTEPGDISFLITVAEAAKEWRSYIEAR